MSKEELIFSFITAAITIIITMISVLALWKLFEKANKPGWLSLIPFYNTFVLFEIIGMSPWWLLILFSIFFFEHFLFAWIYIFNIIPILFFPISLLIVITIWYIMICTCINLCRSFNKDSAFLIGLIFMPYIFFMILAFGKDTYKGANPINDIIFQSEKKIPIIKYCLNCGKRIPNNSMKFCSNCGNSLIKKSN